MNRRGDESGSGLGKLIKLIILVIVLVVVVLGLLGLNVHDFFRNLPDFIKNWGKLPTDLLEDATIYNIDVKILLNDGHGRCIVYETYNIGQNDEWLKNYGVHGWVLLTKDKMGWKEVDDIGMDRITQDIIKKSDITKNLFEEEKAASFKIKEAYERIVAGYGGPSMDTVPDPTEVTINKQYEAFIFAVQEYIYNNYDLSLATFYSSATSEEIKGNYFENVIQQLNSDYSSSGMKFIKKEIDGKEKYLLQDNKNEQYAVHGFELYSIENEKATKLNEEEYPYLYEEEKVKNQIIKQDLYEECYLDSKDFRSAVVSGKNVKLLLKDDKKRCIIYESNDDFSLEHYSIKRNVDYIGRWGLNWLDDKGIWQDIDNRLPKTGEIEEINLARGLIKEEEEFGLYVKDFEYEIEPYSLHIYNSIQSMREGDISWFYVLLETNYNIAFFKKDSSGAISESYNPGELLLAYNNLREREYNIQIGKIRSDSYLWYPKNSDIFVRDGKIWRQEGEKVVEVENTNFDVLPEEWNALFRGITIKEELKKQC